MDLVLTLPQILALIFIAVISAFLAELIVGNAPHFGLIGSLITALLGVLLFLKFPIPDFSFEPRFEEIPVVRALAGGVLFSTLFAFIRKKM